jgi:hypothetical protein
MPLINHTPSKEAIKHWLDKGRRENCLNVPVPASPGTGTISSTKGTSPNMEEEIDQLAAKVMDLMDSVMDLKRKQITSPSTPIGPPKKAKLKRVPTVSFNSHCGSELEHPLCLACEKELSGIISNEL